jgi:hypothetical protein
MSRALPLPAAPTPAAPTPAALTLAALLLAALMLAACTPSPPAAGWAEVLAGRTMLFPDSDPGEPPDRQSWSADGTTIFHTYGLGRYPRKGYWRVEGNRYCSDFPDPGQPPTYPDCYRLQAVEGGVRFVAIREPFALIDFERDWQGTFVD